MRSQTRPADEPLGTLVSTLEHGMFPDRRTESCITPIACRADEPYAACHDTIVDEPVTGTQKLPIFGS